MVFFILALIIAVLCMLAADDPIMGFLISCVWIMLLWMLTSLALTFGVTWQYAATPLVNLADGSQTSGSFFLGSGTIDDQAVYSYYVRFADGHAEQRTTPVSGVKVYDNSDDPRVVAEEKCVSFAEWFLPCELSFNNDADVVELHIPKNSITRDFTLDAQ